VKDQLHIRNAEAAQLARALARQTGKTISGVVLDALRRYRVARGQPAPPDRIAQWRRLLRRDRARLIRDEVRIEASYNPDTGLLGDRVPVQGRGFRTDGGDSASRVDPDLTA
jgi:hypothetical protein